MKNWFNEFIFFKHLRDPPSVLCSIFLNGSLGLLLYLLDRLGMYPFTGRLNLRRLRTGSRRRKVRARERH